eukprot:TRINITY_DN27284_c0_g1_i2.p1 TRINITY_DN27284_c0_g1~~TRINITY_DN27284_c0_g1_i2.p1  ORF type:complete len:1052 (+),score=209.54 TRINITY_DN27284_c0_g1_i2:72-3227(+)
MRVPGRNNPWRGSGEGLAVSGTSAPALGRLDRLQRHRENIRRTARELGLDLSGSLGSSRPAASSSRRPGAPHAPDLQEHEEASLQNEWAGGTVASSSSLQPSPQAFQSSTSKSAALASPSSPGPLELSTSGTSSLLEPTASQSASCAEQPDLCASQHPPDEMPTLTQELFEVLRHFENPGAAAAEAARHEAQALGSPVLSPPPRQPLSPAPIGGSAGGCSRPQGEDGEGSAHASLSATEALLGAYSTDRDAQPEHLGFTEEMLSRTSACPHCGSRYLLDSIYCRSCGTKRQVEAASSSLRSAESLAAVWPGSPPPAEGSSTARGSLTTTSPKNQEPDLAFGAILGRWRQQFVDFQHAVDTTCGATQSASGLEQAADHHRSLSSTDSDPEAVLLRIKRDLGLDVSPPPLVQSLGPPWVSVNGEDPLRDLLGSPTGDDVDLLSGDRRSDEVTMTDFFFPAPGPTAAPATASALPPLPPPSLGPSSSSSSKSAMPAGAATADDVAAAFHHPAATIAATGSPAAASDCAEGSPDRDCPGHAKPAVTAGGAAERSSSDDVPCPVLSPALDQALLDRLQVLEAEVLRLQQEQRRHGPMRGTTSAGLAGTGEQPESCPPSPQRPEDRGSLADLAEHSVALSSLALSASSSLFGHSSTQGIAAGTLSMDPEARPEELRAEATVPMLWSEKPSKVAPASDASAEKTRPNLEAATKPADVGLEASAPEPADARMKATSDLVLDAETCIKAGRAAMPEPVAKDSIKASLGVAPMLAEASVNLSSGSTLEEPPEAGAARAAPAASCFPSKLTEVGVGTGDDIWPAELACGEGGTQPPPVWRPTASAVRPWAPSPEAGSGPLPSRTAGPSQQQERHAAPPPPLLQGAGGCCHWQLHYGEPPESQLGLPKAAYCHAGAGVHHLRPPSPLPRYGAAPAAAAALASQAVGSGGYPPTTWDWQGARPPGRGGAAAPWCGGLGPGSRHLPPHLPPTQQHGPPQASDGSSLTAAPPFLGAAACPPAPCGVGRGTQPHSSWPGANSTEDDVLLLRAYEVYRRQQLDLMGTR